MEYFVNLDPRDAPADLVAIQVEIPDHVTTERIAIDKLPDNWKQRPYSTKLQQIGAAWLSGRFSACLMVTSVVIPQETNLLINPDHPDFSKLIFQPPKQRRIAQRRQDATRNCTCKVTDDNVLQALPYSGR